MQLIASIFGVSIARYYVRINETTF